MEKFPGEMYAAMSSSAPNGGSQLASILVEKYLKENIIEQGQALHGTRYPTYRVFIAISDDNAHTAHLAHNPRSLEPKPKDYEIIKSGRPAGDAVAALRVLLEEIRREFATDMGKMLRK